MIAQVLRYLFPDIETFRDVTIVSRRGVESIESWRRVEPQPTQEQIEAAWPEAEAALSSVAALRAGLLSAWAKTFTAGEQAFLKPIYNAALSAFDYGDVAKCKEIISTAPSITADLDAKKATIVALFPA